MLIVNKVQIGEADFFVLAGVLFEIRDRTPTDHGRPIGRCIRARRVTDFDTHGWDNNGEDEWVQVERLPKIGLTEAGALDWWMRAEIAALTGGGR